MPGDMATALLLAAEQFEELRRDVREIKEKCQVFEISGGVRCWDDAPEKQELESTVAHLRVELESLQSANTSLKV